FDDEVVPHPRGTGAEAAHAAETLIEVPTEIFVETHLTVEATRGQLERKLPRPFWDRLFRWGLLRVFPHRGWLRGAALGAWLWRWTGLQALFRALGLPQLLPPRLRALEALTPPVDLLGALRGLPESRPPKDIRHRVAVLEGCVQAVFFSGVNRATAELLSAEGVEVVPVVNQGCCGALEIHAGELEAGRTRARALIDAFEGVEADAIIVNSAGCGSTLKNYAELFEPEDPYRMRAEALAARVEDVLEFLARLEPRARFRPLEGRAAYHDACHLAHAQGVRTAPRSVLGRVPGLEIVEVPNGELCCGSAGIWNVLHPEPADALGRRKADDIRSTRVSLLLAANPGCLLQIRKHLGADVQTRHPVELLAEQLERAPL
ncbi:MAG: heterodisulfide reductase-related iron-sulfur binding cluster, partial [Myxococcota bacterium]